MTKETFAGAQSLYRSELPQISKKNRIFKGKHEIVQKTQAREFRQLRREFM